MDTTLWVLRRRDDGWGYDEASGFVVRARDEAQARRIAARNAGDEGPATWRNKERSTCTILRSTGRTGVVLRDFHHG